MEYAVLRLGGKQYKVSKGSIIDIDRMDIKKGQDAVFEDVLLLVSDGKVKVGTPIVPLTKVKAKVLDHVKGEKIRVAKFKAKVRYRRVMGFRPMLTRLQITDIESSETNEKPKTSASKSKVTPKKMVSKITRKTPKKD